MKRIVIFFIALFPFISVFSQKKDFTYHLYGFVRGDLFYNSRANVAPVDGNFYMYPLDIDLDAEGKDLNENPNGSFYTFTTRLGLDITGPMLGSARTAAKIETDFGGFSTSTTLLRIRQAYVTLSWDKSQILIGQTWHPLFGSVVPDVLNLSTGAPFQPFNRSPLLRYQYNLGNTKLTAATIWQLQSLSSGPSGASEDYIKNSMIPEVYIGADYIHNGWIVGAGAHMISLKPRTSSMMEGKRYKVNERMTAFSFEGHLKYSGKNYTFSAKSLFASAIDHTALLGGYGISDIDPVTGKQEYTPFHHSTSWVNATFGKRWQWGIFAGYTKNLGTDNMLINTSTMYGKGLDIDQLYMINPSFSYNHSNWKLGVEYSLSTAYYGDVDQISGKVENTHAVSNHRIVGLLVYHF